MLREFVVGETGFRAGARTDGRGGPYCEQIVNDVGLGRYFEAARAGRIFTLSTAVGATLNANASPIAAAGTPVWALFNPPSNARAAVILKASCLLAPGASATPIIPVWNFLTNLTGQTALGNQAALSAVLSSTGSPGTMRSFINQALIGGAAAQTFLRPWACNFNNPRLAGAASQTAGGVLVEETDGSIIVPPGAILSVAFNVAGAAVVGCVSVVYAEVDWQPAMGGGPVGDPFLVDSYSEINQDTEEDINADAVNNSAIGQSFNGIDAKLGSAKFYIVRRNAPTGNVVAKLYAHTGVFGTSSLPTGAALATSDVVDASTIPASLGLFTFTFSGANQFAMQRGTNYVIAIEYSSGDATNRIGVWTDKTSPTHGGNMVFHDTSGWNAVAAEDACFYVYIA